jgi:copper chaperone NosL
MRATLRLLLVVLVVLAGCAPGPLAPVAIDTAADVCAHCRMTIVSTATAAQIVAAGDDPVLFDDIGCLRDYVAAAGLGAEAMVVVADHRTGEWIDGRTAVFTKTALDTPMGSGLVAHASTASRDLDAAASRGTAVPARSVLP